MYKVEFYKEAQYYSHVIHLVKPGQRRTEPQSQSIKAFVDTFPAGTLSGAPKVKAMQLISEYEPHSRGAYGGCIGFIGLNGTLNKSYHHSYIRQPQQRTMVSSRWRHQQQNNEEYELQK